MVASSEMVLPSGRNRQSEGVSLFVNSTLKIHAMLCCQKYTPTDCFFGVVKNTLLQIAFSAILPNGCNQKCSRFYPDRTVNSTATSSIAWII